MDNTDPCSPIRSEAMVNDFAVASQRSDAAAAASLFADDSNFEWFSTTSSVENFVAYDPMDLEDRFRQRFRDGEKFELVEFNWNGPIQMGNINFDFEMTWANPDLASGPDAARGKGAINCDDASIIAWSLAMKPLSPGPTQNTTDQGQTSSGSTCDTSEIESGGFPEMRGEGAEAWALLWETPPWEVGQDVKVVWRMAGSGDFAVRAVGPDGAIVGPTAGPTGPRNSNWDRPGQEWGTSFNLPSEGCWQLEAQRTDAVSTFTIDVITG